MSRKNFKVDTATNGQTAKQDTKHIFVVEKTNVPTGKVKTAEDREKRRKAREKRRKAREEQYKTFRVNTLKRRAKRMGLSKEDTEAKVKELLNQLDTPNSYSVLILFNPSDKDLVKQALLKEDLAWNLISDSHLFIDADQETLATIRSIMPPSAKIHPYVKKKKPVLAAPTINKEKKPSNNNKNVAHAAKIARKKRNGNFHKRPNVAGMRKKDRKEFKAKVLAIKASWKAQKKASGTTVHMKPKKSSTAPKKASTLKEAA